MSLLTDNASLMTYSIYAVYTLLTATVLLGCFLIIRKISQRQPSFEGDLEFDHERIARELDREIKDLENLRNRIFPASHFSKSSLIVQVPVSASVAVLDDADILKSVEAQLSSQAVKADLPDLSEIAQGTGASPESMAAFQAKVNELTEALNRSKAELKTLRETTASGAASGADPAGGPSRAELDKLTKELELKVSQQKEEIQKHIGSVKHLEKIIGEYQLFEEDFALVKKYRKENEILRTELIKRGLSEPDIIKLLEAADALTPRTTKPVQVASVEEAPAAAPVEVAPTPAPVSTPAPVAQSATAPSPAPASETVSATPAAAEAEAPVVQSAPSPTPPAEAVSAPSTPAAAPAETPVKSSDAQSAESVEKIQAEAEAMAESVFSEDELMAEFEKLLNEKDQST